MKYRTVWTHQVSSTEYTSRRQKVGTCVVELECLFVVLGVQVSGRDLKVVVFICHFVKVC